mmetsp:Transcript_10622/g.30457  ORF Transcript_10622/g.30457 Transcript_10622/m.30457 type:complete len:700 (+) Transcript_10622:293-2392(+)
MGCVQDLESLPPRTKRGRGASKVFQRQNSEDEHTYSRGVEVGLVLEAVVDGELFLVGIEGLAVLNFGDEALLVLLLLLAGELLLRLLHLGDVAGGVNHLFSLLEIHLLLQGVLHPLGVTLAVQAANAVAHLFEDPALGADGPAKFVVVGDDDDAAFVLRNGTGEGPQRVTVEVVGGLVEDHDVGLVPHGGADDDLDLLAAGERVHAEVGAVLAVQAAVLEVLLDVGLGEGADVHAGAGRNLLVHVHDPLGEALLGEAGGGQVDVVVHVLALELDLVLVLLGALDVAAHQGELLDDAVLLADLVVLVLPLELEGFVHDPLLLFGHDHGDLVHGLLVVTVLVPPADVLVRGLVEVLLDVVEGVLGHVGHAQGRVRPAGPLRRLDFTREALDHGGLAGSVRANAAHSAGQGHLDCDARDGEVLVDRVPVAHTLHLHEGLALGLDAIEGARLGEGELHLGGLELEVGPGLGHLLDEVGEVAVVEVQLEVVELENVGAHIIQEARVVGHDDRGDVGQAHEVVLHPLDVHHVQVVRRLVQEEDVRLEQHGPGEGELHAPPARQGHDAVVEHLLREVIRRQGGANLLPGNPVTGNARVREHVLGAAQVGQLAQNVCLDEDRAQLGWEGLDLGLRHGAHQSSLATVVGAEKAVTVATAKLKLGVVEEDLGAVGEGELAVAEHLLAVVNLLLLGDLLDELDALRKDFG